MPTGTPPGSEPGAPPIFIVGPPRSGAGILQWALRQHPDLWGAEETDYLTDLLAALRASYHHGTRAGDGQWLAGLGVAWEEFAAAAGRGVAALYASRSGGRRWVEQTDRYVHDLAGIAALFPDAVYLVTGRDGRAAAAALRRTEAIGHEEAGRVWRSATEAARAWLAAEGSRSHHVRYQELVSAPEETLDGVYRFLGLPATAASAAYIAARTPPGAAAPPPAWQEWTTAERLAFHEIAGDLLIELGYAADDGWVDAG